jgi:hypothetical protein
MRTLTFSIRIWASEGSGTLGVGGVLEPVPRIDCQIATLLDLPQPWLLVPSPPCLICDQLEQESVSGVCFLSSTGADPYRPLGFLMLLVVVVCLFVFGSGLWSQGLSLARQALYHLSLSTSPSQASELQPPLLSSPNRTDHLIPLLRTSQGPPV